QPVGSGAAPPSPPPAAVHFTAAELGSLTVLSGVLSNRYQVNDTPAGTPTEIDGGPAADSFFVLATRGPLTADGGGVDHVTLGSTSPSVVVGGSLADLRGPVNVRNAAGKSLS